MNPLRDTAVDRLRQSAADPLFASDRYQLLEEIGRGGMGTVYRAMDHELGREVAIKIPNGIAASAVERRLHREVGVLARLEHPGIVPIHDAGRLADGRLFYVMKQVRGQTLRQYLPELRDLSARLRIFERIAEPVAFAHDAGVIHRDLKPDNVMIGAFGEVLVMDWGVARILGPEPDDDPATSGSGTAAGTIVGTPGYMAPEQTRGAVADPRSDVYGLGAILYLLLTDADPDAEAGQTITRATEVPKPLRAICARALSETPGGRYGSVGALVDDVRRFGAGQSVTAHQESLLERLARFGRTYRAAIVLVFAYLVMRVAVALLAGW